MVVWPRPWHWRRHCSALPGAKSGRLLPTRVMVCVLPLVDASRCCDRRGVYGESSRAPKFSAHRNSPKARLRARRNPGERMTSGARLGRGRAASVWGLESARCKVPVHYSLGACGVGGSTFSDARRRSLKRLHSTAFYCRPRLPSFLLPPSSRFPLPPLTHSPPHHCLVRGLPVPRVDLTHRQATGASSCSETINPNFRSSPAHDNHAFAPACCWHDGRRPSVRFAAVSHGEHV